MIGNRTFCLTSLCSHPKSNPVRNESVRAQVTQVITDAIQERKVTLTMIINVVQLFCNAFALSSLIQNLRGRFFTKCFTCRSEKKRKKKIASREGGRFYSWRSGVPNPFFTAFLLPVLNLVSCA